MVLVWRVDECHYRGIDFLLLVLAVIRCVWGGRNVSRGRYLVDS